MSQFFSRLNYSFGNEDWSTELQALKIKKDDNVICITASGDRPLHLLLDDCKSLTSLDINPIQNHLLNLKCAAMEILDYEDYIAFLEGTPAHANKMHSFKKILNNMNGESAEFWLKNKKIALNGVLYQGKTESLCKIISKVIRTLRPKKVKRLFQFDNLDEQKKFLSAEWDTFLIRKCFDVGLSPFLIRWFNSDPGLYSYVDPSIRLGSYIYNRMMHSLNCYLAKENPFLSLLFKGTISKEAFPPYLTAKGSEVIRTRLNRLTVKTMELNSYLETVPPESYDCFSLSDVASYVGQEDFNRMIRSVYRAAKPSARFCIREFSSSHKIPAELQSHFQRDQILEKRLESEDRWFVYRFMVGKIVK
jgi:S-adenosylmethionine-diacylglycerol 3-amino-3-carboxypropyl transferase